jgi:hypothetical protein
LIDFQQTEEICRLILADMDHENIVPAFVRNTFETQRKGGSGGDQKKVRETRKTTGFTVEANIPLPPLPLFLRVSRFCF